MTLLNPASSVRNSPSIQDGSVRATVIRKAPHTLFEDSASRVSDVILRPYQDRAKAHILACKDRGMERVIVVMPTGTGKTTLFSALIGEMAASYKSRSLVLAHREELLDQALRRIGRQNPNLSVAIEGGARKATDFPDVIVASVQSIGRPDSRRLDGFDPGFIIIDEAHHAAANTYQHVMRRFGCYEGNVFTVGVTATPHRMDNKSLHGSDEAIFEDVAFSYTLRDAISDGWLADLRGYRVATGIDISKVRSRYGDYNARQLQDAVNVEARNEVAYTHWAEVARDRRTIVFCTGVEHAEDVAQLFRDRGVAAESVNGAMKASDREAIISRFRSGKTQVLSNVDIATEGFDVPEAGCVLMLRPTQSWALYTQMVGRGIRVLPDTIDGLVTADARREVIRGSEKPDCIVIDIVDNVLNADPRVPKEEGQEPKPSLAAIVGLPPDLDLEGHSMDEAIKVWESLEPAHRAVLFKRPTKFDDLGTTLTAVDLLAELSVPEGMASVSKNAWMKTGDGLYLLACGSSAREQHRIAKLECDTLGRFRLHLESDTLSPKSFECGEELLRAFTIADKRVKEVWPFVGGLTSTRGLWRQEPVSEQQLKELRRLGVEPSLVEVIENAGQAWTLIEIKRREQAQVH